MANRLRVEAWGTGSEPPSILIGSGQPGVIAESRRRHEAPTGATRDDHVIVR